MKIKGKEKILVPKFDSLFKHTGRHKDEVLKPKVAIGLFCFNLKNQHV
jgi:hypothetical protein